MLGFWVGVGLAVLVGLLALHRPILARMGVGYALQRKKQTALVVAGLMVATTVLVAAGVAADSSARSFTESLLSRLHLTDATARGVDGTFLPVERIEGIVDDPVLARGVQAHAVALRAELTAESAVTGLGDEDVAVWGIDPASHGRIARWVRAEGQPPTSVSSWPAGGVVANRLAATSFGLAVGDDVNVYLTGEELVVPNTTLYEGRWELAAGTPEAGFVHHPQDAYTFRHPADRTVEEGSIVFVATAAPEVEVYLKVVDGDRKEHVAGPSPGRAEVRISFTDYADGRYDVTVESTRAVQQGFVLNVTQDARRTVGDRSMTAKLVGVVETEGSDPLGHGPAVFLPLPAMQDLVSAPGRANVLLLDFRDDADQEALAQRFREVAQEAWSPSSAFVRADRVNIERERAEIEEAVEATFLGIGSFSIVAGFMLIGVLMALLVEERKQVLATARALGAQRSDLTRIHAHEGALYAALAAAAGLIAGAGLAALAMRYVRTLFASEGVRFVLNAKTETILSAIGFGFALVLVVLAFAAYRATRLHLVSALRGESGEAPRKARRLVAGALLAALGGAVWGLGVVGAQSWSQVVGPALVALGVAPLLARFLGRDLGATLPAAGLAAYLFLSFRFLPLEDEVDAILLPVRGVLLASCLAVVAAYSGWVHALVLRALAFAPRTRPLFATALGHLRQRPGRAALTIAMFGTVLVVLTALGTLFETFTAQDLGDGGGFEVLGDAPRPLGDPAQYLRDHPPAARLDPLGDAEAWAATPWVPGGVRAMSREFVVAGGETRTTYASVPRTHYITQSAVGVTPEWAARIGFQAGQLAPRYADLDAAFAAVARDPGLAVVADGFSFYDLDREEYAPVRVGDVFLAGREPGQGVERPGRNVTIIATVAGSGVAGAYLHPSVMDSVAAMSGLDAPGTRVWASARGDPHALAQSLEGAFRRAGMTTTVIGDIDSEERQVGEAIQSIINVFVGLGIVIGMVSLALIMGRNVLLRRAEVGTMRALGAQPRDVLLMFSFEALYLTTWSILIGLSVGLLLAAAMIMPEGLGRGLRVDWGSLATLYAVTALGAVLSAFLPAWRASRIRPAQAVRYAE